MSTMPVSHQKASSGASPTFWITLNKSLGLPLFYHPEEKTHLYNMEPLQCVLKLFLPAEYLAWE